MLAMLPSVSDHVASRGGVGGILDDCIAVAAADASLFSLLPPSALVPAVSPLSGGESLAALPRWLPPAYTLVVDNSFADWCYFNLSNR